MKKVRLDIRDHRQRMEILKILHDNNYYAEAVSTGKVKDDERMLIEIEVPDAAMKGVSNEHWTCFG